MVTHHDLSILVSKILNRYTTIQYLGVEKVPEGFLYTPRYYWLRPDGKTKKLKATVPNQMTDKSLAETAHDIAIEIISNITDEVVRDFFDSPAGKAYEQTMRAQ